MSRHWLIIPAAGVSQRYGGAVPKQYQTIAGRPMLCHTLQAIATKPWFAARMIVLSKQDQWFKDMIPDELKRQVTPVTGNTETRAQSVLNALNALKTTAHDDDWVWVHDAARPLIHDDDIQALKASLTEQNRVGSILVRSVTATLKTRNEANQPVTVPRNAYATAETPQVFRYQHLLGAIEGAIEKGVVPTDEAMAMELAQYNYEWITAAHPNIKLTHPQDKHFATYCLSTHHHSGIESN